MSQRTNTHLPCTTGHTCRGNASGMLENVFLNGRNRATSSSITTQRCLNPRLFIPQLRPVTKLRFPFMSDMYYRCCWPSDISFRILQPRGNSLLYGWNICILKFSCRSTALTLFYWIRIDITRTYQLSFASLMVFWMPFCCVLQSNLPRVISLAINLVIARHNVEQCHRG